MGVPLPGTLTWGKVGCPESRYACKMKSSLLVRRVIMVTFKWFVVVQNGRGSGAYYRGARRI